MAKLSTDELLDAFKELTLLELSEFVKQFEETFEVTAAAPVAVAAAGRRRCRPGRGRRGAVRVRRHPRGCRREEDRRHQGRPRDRFRPGPQGGQGSGRRRSQAAAREGQQGRRRGRQGQARGRRRFGHRQVVRLRRRLQPQRVSCRAGLANRPALRVVSAAVMRSRLSQTQCCRSGGVRYSDSSHRRGACGGSWVLAEGFRVGIGIQVEGLTKSFGSQRIWEDVTFDIPAG